MFAKLPKEIKAIYNAKFSEENQDDVQNGPQDQFVDTLQMTTLINHTEEGITCINSFLHCIALSYLTTGESLTGHSG